MPDLDVGSEAIDTNQVGFLSMLAHHSQLSLPNFIRLFRNQSSSDSRPNKALFELPVPPNSKRAHVFPHWNSIVRSGVQPRWRSTKPSSQTTRPPNHNSIASHTASIRRHIRTGQRDGRFFVLHESVLKLWPEVFISPIGIAEKGDNDTRLIDDYSYPRGCSVNDFTDDGNFPSISYNPPGDIARPFRHVPIHEDAVHMFAFIFDGYVVIDLSCGFGWGPTTSSVDSSNFVGNVWCDDQMCVEILAGSRCHDANIALRRAMAAVLGPSAINDEKFTEWSQINKALGLVWNTSEGTVSIPLCKLQKAERRVYKQLEDGRSTKRDLISVLGAMRHVSTCFPPARAFYQ
ncbi:hypothetical protein F442_14065 [Phytophthora nicotianae P10297]|uniref:Uncharacterized protein n=1 Tax=Phytophthora nicotianae P10297 TaxID=1317064 RepID=W2YTN8_PHYNI|nr:hypothetical protein F442_14065 [Phytophthora nicotianae P10297]